jgi:hypothetical protein
MQTSRKQKFKSARLLLYVIFFIKRITLVPLRIRVIVRKLIKSTLIIFQHTCQQSTDEREHPSSGDCWGHNTFMPYRRQLEFIPATKRNHICMCPTIINSKPNPYDPVTLKIINKIHETKCKGKLLHRRRWMSQIICYSVGTNTQRHLGIQDQSNVSQVRINTVYFLKIYLQNGLSPKVIRPKQFKHVLFLMYVTCAATLTFCVINTQCKVYRMKFLTILCIPFFIQQHYFNMFLIEWFAKALQIILTHLVYKIQLQILHST